MFEVIKTFYIYNIVNVVIATSKRYNFNLKRMKHSNVGQSFYKVFHSIFNDISMAAFRQIMKCENDRNQLSIN